MSGRFFAENTLSESSKRFMPHFTVLFFTSAPAGDLDFSVNPTSPQSFSVTSFLPRTASSNSVLFSVIYFCPFPEEPFGSFYFFIFLRRCCDGMHLPFLFCLVCNTGPCLFLPGSVLQERAYRIALLFSGRFL